jgi:hypothetical protein
MCWIHKFVFAEKEKLVEVFPLWKIRPSIKLGAPKPRFYS